MLIAGGAKTKQVSSALHERDGGQSDKAVVWPPSQLPEGEGRLGSHCRANQCDCRTMACELGQLRVVPKPQREHVAVASDNNGFPPAVFQSFLGDDEVTRRDLVPGPGQASRHWQLVVVFADGGLRLGRELHDDLAVQALPDVRHKTLAVRVKPSVRERSSTVIVSATTFGLTEASTNFLGLHQCRLASS